MIIQNLNLLVDSIIAILKSVFFFDKIDLSSNGLHSWIIKIIWVDCYKIILSWLLFCEVSLTRKLLATVVEKMFSTMLDTILYGKSLINTKDVVAFIIIYENVPSILAKTIFFKCPKSE